MATTAISDHKDRPATPQRPPMPAELFASICLAIGTGIIVGSIAGIVWAFVYYSHIK